jgi:hypothetical protein
MTNWIKIFRNLLLSPDNRDFYQAIELKNNHFPLKLYRFRPLKSPEDFIRLKNYIYNKNLFLSPRNKLITLRPGRNNQKITNPLRRKAIHLTVSVILTFIFARKSPKFPVDFHCF